ADALRARAARPQRSAARLQIRGVADIDAACYAQQIRACRALELAPKRKRVLCEPNVNRIVVGESEDPAGTMRRATAVTKLELLENHDVLTRFGEPPRSRQADDPGSDDHNVDTFHAATM